jgi:hypothetical protein
LTGLVILNKDYIKSLGGDVIKVNDPDPKNIGKKIEDFFQYIIIFTHKPLNPYHKTHCAMLPLPFPSIPFPYHSITIPIIYL